MNILVIGSKGFIGSHIYQHFAPQHQVWSCDVAVDYVAPNYYQIDATNSDFKTIFSEQSFDVCINCSGAASVPDSLKNPLRDFTLNTLNVFRILDAIRQYQPTCRFINFSSAAVYGNPQRLPIQENDPLKPLSPYGLHKLAAENICQEFQTHYGISTCSLRVFSAYGEGLSKQLFWDLFQKTQQIQPVSIYGTGQESRDFIYIKDLVQIVELIANNPHFTPTVINVANGEEITIEKAVQTFFALFQQPIEYQFTRQQRAGDPLNWVADIKHLKQLGYVQQYSLADGLKNYYQWSQQFVSK